MQTSGVFFELPFKVWIVKQNALFVGAEFGRHFASRV